MATLKKYHKEFIVKQLAMFERQAEIIDRLKEEFGVSVSQPQLSYYNPETSQGGRELAQKWKHLYNRTREKFIEGTIEIPIAHKQYRLRELQKMYERQVAASEDAEARETIITAAKEMGGAYSSNGALVAAATKEGNVNFYQQVNQKILQMNEKAN